MGLSGEDRTWDQLQMMTKLALPLGSGANIPHESQLIRVLSYFMYVNNFLIHKIPWFMFSLNYDMTVPQQPETSK